MVVKLSSFVVIQNKDGLLVRFRVALQNVNKTAGQVFPVLRVLVVVVVVVLTVDEKNNSKINNNSVTQKTYT